MRHLTGMNSARAWKAWTTSRSPGVVVSSHTYVRGPKGGRLALVEATTAPELPPPTPSAE
jgi:hypothetical protein